MTDVAASDSIQRSRAASILRAHRARVSPNEIRDGCLRGLSLN